MTFERMCRNCGNLGVRKLPSLDFVSPDGAYREDGRIVEVDGKPIYTPSPECYAGIDLFRSDKINGESDQQKRKAFLWDDRSDCPEWINFKPGRSPMDLEEMNRESRLLVWQEQREEADRRWREAESLRQGRQHKWNLFGMFAAALIAAFATLAGVMLARQPVNQHSEPNPAAVPQPVATPTAAANVEPAKP